MTTAMRDAFAPASSPKVPSARIHRVLADGHVDLDFGGGRIIDAVSVLAPYVPATGRIVSVLTYPDGQMLVLGETRTANATTQRETVALAFPFNVLPGAAANPLVVPTTATGGWRSTDGWGSAGSRPIPLDAPAQGRLDTARDFYRGAWFYGVGAFAAAAGRKSGAPTFHWSSGSSGYPVTVYLALHAHETRPDGGLTWVTGAMAFGPFALSSSGDVTLPAEWGQMLLDGRAKGVGMLYLSTGTGAYAVQKGRSADVNSGRLSIPWT